MNARVIMGLSAGNQDEFSGRARSFLPCGSAIQRRVGVEADTRTVQMWVFGSVAPIDGAHARGMQEVGLAGVANGTRHHHRARFHASSATRSSACCVAMTRMSIASTSAERECHADPVNPMPPGTVPPRGYDMPAINYVRELFVPVPDAHESNGDAEWRSCDLAVHQMDMAQLEKENT